MKLLKLAITMSFVVLVTTVCYAGPDDDWVFINRSYNDYENMRVDVSKSSIESVSPTMVIALVRLDRADKSRPINGKLSDASKSEIVYKFDCEKPRLKPLSGAQYYFSKPKVEVKFDQLGTPVFQKAEGMIEQVRQYVCKSEGKIK